MVQTQQRRHRDPLSLLFLTASLYLDNEWWMRLSLSVAGGQGCPASAFRTKLFRDRRSEVSVSHSLAVGNTQAQEAYAKQLLGKAALPKNMVVCITVDSLVVPLQPMNEPFASPQLCALEPSFGLALFSHLKKSTRKNKRVRATSPLRRNVIHTWS